MKPKVEQFIQCVVDVKAGNSGRKEDADKVDCTMEHVTAKSIRKLVIGEMSREELQELGFATAEGSEAGHSSGKHADDGRSSTTWMVEATIKVIKDQLNNLDIESEMLSLRRKALKRRLRILERIAQSLDPGGENRKSA